MHNTDPVGSEQRTGAGPIQNLDRVFRSRPRCPANSQILETNLASNVYSLPRSSSGRGRSVLATLWGRAVDRSSAKTDTIAM